MGTTAVVAIVVSVVVVVTLVVWAVADYNGLIRRRNAYHDAFARIDAQLTRRHELIPALVETIEGHLRDEQRTFVAVVTARDEAVEAQHQARIAVGQPTAMRELAGAETAVTRTLGRLFAVSESSPDLKASRTMAQLSGDLVSTEDSMAIARQAYNDAVLAYNNRRETFPTNLLAGRFGFGPAAPLLIEEPGQRQSPRISC